MRHRYGIVGVLSACVFVVGLSDVKPAAQQPPAGKIDFVRDVQPLFRQYCLGCHGPTQQMNGFRLDRRSDAMRGGTIAVIGAGNSDGSRLYKRLIGDQYGPQMPPTGALRPEQVAIIKAWIDQGAEWPDAASGEEPLPPPDAGAMRISAALRRGDGAAFKAAIDAAPDSVKLKGERGISPLMTATLYAGIDAMRDLLQRGADANVRNEAGATALMWAVTDVAKTRLLLEHGAQADVKSDNGRTPLLIASGLRGSAPVVKLLLEHGANPSVTAAGLIGASNPLTEAAASGDPAVFQLLVEHGADVKNAGPFALPLAKLTRCDACAEVLLKAAPPMFLSIAASVVAPPLGTAEVTRAFLELGGDPNARDPEGRPLIVNVAGSDALPVDTVQALLKRGADVNAKTREGRTALDWAMLRGNTPVVDLLVKAGAVRGMTAPEPALSYKAAASPRDAVLRSLPVLQRTDATFLRKSGCVSCHNNSLPQLAVAAARMKGLPIDGTMERESTAKVGVYLESWRERVLQNYGIPGDADTISYILLGLAAGNHPPDAATDAMAQFLVWKQLPDGHWQVLAHRPPIESSSIEVTATSMRALQRYAPAAQRPAYDNAIQRAAAWLRSATPTSNEDAAYHLLGLAWARADRAAIATAARALAARQRPDGGWSQIPTLESDAYATGQALVALSESGAMTVNDPVFQRGVQFLIKTQLDDGTWFVRARAIEIQPQFDAAFPHGRSAWISAAATSWATRALTIAIAPAN